MAITWIDATELSEPTADSAQEAAQFASFILYKLTGEMYPGTSTSTELYIADDKTPVLSTLSNGVWESVIGEHLAIFESQDHQQQRLFTRSKPIVSVDTIFEGVKPYLPFSYYIGNKRFVVKKDGKPWDMSAGILITYTHGAQVPIAGKLAAKELADQLVLLETNPAACALPDRVTAVSRQGISYTILDPQTFLNDGRTGLYYVDLFIKSVNPRDLRKRSKIVSADMPQGIRK